MIVVENYTPNFQDPIELAICRRWMNQALKEYLDEQPLEGSDENREYHDMYADGVVRALWAFAQKENIVACAIPVVKLMADCGARVSIHGLEELLSGYLYRTFAQEYATWRNQAGKVLYEKTSVAYQREGDAALNLCC